MPGRPKSDAGNRKVALPRLVVEALGEHLDTWAAPGPDGLVFPARKGGYLRRATFRRRVWVKAAGVEGLRFHDLRHSAATMAAARVE